MENNSCKKAVLEFELAVIKELYKNNKISDNEYGYALKKIQDKLDKIIVEENLYPCILDICV